MPRLRTITVARKPLSEGSVAKNALKHGTGGLNIDASRIRSVVDASERRTSKRGASHLFALGNQQEGERHNSQGRWPANLILQHKPGCEQVGTKKVRSGPTTRNRSTALGIMNDDGWEPQPTKDNRPWNADGTETVDAWNCVPDCPIADLDEQSGTSDTSKRGPICQDGRSSIFGRGAYQDVVFDRITDKGGASRFFKQVQSDD